jgi:hypothetical protein
MEMDNLDTASATKSPKDKKIDVKVFNRDSDRCGDSLDRHRMKKSREPDESFFNQHSQHSSLPHLPIKPPTANRTDSLLCSSHNNLNPTQHQSSEDRVSQSSDQFNVSRQTSTSDFDQDENSFQEVVDLGPGLLFAGCDDEEDGDDVAFQDEHDSHDTHGQCNCSSGKARTASKRPAPPSLSVRRRIHQNLLSKITGHDPGQVEGEALQSLLEGIQVVEISPEDSEAPDMDDIPLPPQTPILNRQWLKKAAKYLDYNFLYKNFFKDYQSE